jgi:hypothetical protein
VPRCRDTTRSERPHSAPDVVQRALVLELAAILQLHVLVQRSSTAGRHASGSGGRRCGLQAARSGGARSKQARQQLPTARGLLLLLLQLVMVLLRRVLLRRVLLRRALLLVR